MKLMDKTSFWTNNRVLHVTYSEQYKYFHKHFMIVFTSRLADVRLFRAEPIIRKQSYGVNFISKRESYKTQVDSDVERRTCV